MKLFGDFYGGERYLVSSAVANAVYAYYDFWRHGEIRTSLLTRTDSVWMIPGTNEENE